MNSAQIEGNELLKYLPHRSPFLFIDKVSFISTGDLIVAEKKLIIADDYVSRESRSFGLISIPIMLEALAQASCVLYTASMPTNKKREFYLTSIKSTTKNQAFAPCILKLTSHAIKMVSFGGIFKGNVDVDGTVVDAEMTFACKEVI